MNNETKHICVFVYGTLKQGYGNNKHFLRDAYYISKAESVDNSYIMYCNGGFPMTIDVKSTGFYKIKGELYFVNQKILEGLDMLESNGSMYTRELRHFIADDGKIYEAWIYLFNRTPWKYSSNNRNLNFNIDTDNKKVVEWIRK